MLKNVLTTRYLFIGESDSPLMILGITGENCAGKDTVADYLKKKGFYYLSLSDVIREELTEEGKEITRESLINKGNELRKKFGPSILAVKTIAKIEKGKNYVVVSIRNPSEAEELKKQPNMVLLYLTATPEIRFQRMKTREREGDPKTFEAFLKIEEAEARSADKSKQQLLEVFEMARKKIVNDSDFKHLFDEVDRVLSEISSEYKTHRPSWDKYFMDIAKVVASRSNCIKRHVAAIIIKDKRIVSTGYNGTPRGTKNCDEGGCRRCNNFAESGTKLDECVCSHAEENAIVQAGYHGISINGTTLYSTYSPCLTCTKMIINAGIREVVYNEDYPLNETAVALLKEADVILRKLKVSTHANS